MDEEGFATPEAAALGGFSRGAEARVLSVKQQGNLAEVALLVGPNYPYWVRCHYTGGKWFEGDSSNLPNPLFDEPGTFD